ncbi:MAG: hypothetical protein ACFCUE_07570 [Candidatus Bathyarchaeia archaeon]|jgi:hypothetical protein
MTRIFSDGFESGNFDAWTANGTEGGSTISVLNESPYEGTKAVKVYFDAFENDAYVYKSISMDEAYIGCRLNVSDFHGYNIYRMMQFLWLFRSSTPNAFLILKAVDDTSNPLLCLGYYDFSLYTQVVNGTHEVSKNAYHWVELYWKRSTGTIRVWLDGTECTELRVDGGNFGTNPVDRAGIGAYQRGIGTAEQTEATIYIDNVVIADSYIGADSTLHSVTETVQVADAVFRHKGVLPLFDVLALEDESLSNKSLFLVDPLIVEDSKTGTFKTVLIDTDNISIVDLVAVDKGLLVIDDVTVFEAVESGAIGGRKTRLFLVLGDLAIQLNGE